MSDMSSSADITSVDLVVRAIREKILEGELEPGSRLQQDHLSEMLGVSRTPLRTALAMIAQQGLIEYEANRGYRVRSFSLADVQAAFAVRAELEGLACRYAACRRLPDETLARFGELVAEGDRILASGVLDPALLPAYRRMNVAFHELIMAAAGNPWIHSFVHQTHNVPLASDRIFLWDNFDIIYRSHDDHHRIADAIAQGEAVRAEHLMIEHVTFAGKLLMKRLEADPRGVFVSQPQRRARSRNRSARNGTAA
ncbi:MULTISPECIES: GntR family transcriptional regulator [unclassified Chelatococcus]|uniref:GntR family transcriptional regulator n=1 Tax=unclassified Chelatococcus TaxID=2638111 RepID=UPI000377BF30|nr:MULTISPECIES: GntR family transcriptional regulator [unclassified Chelatococcus]